jgi:hypothetical protein
MSLAGPAAVIAATLASALALVQPASAAYRPLLTATGTDTAVTVSYSQASSNDGAAALAFHAPSSYAAKLRARVGAVVGTATGNAVAADVDGATMPLEGTIRVASPAAPLAAGSSTTVGDAARACSRTVELAATWSLVLDGFNQSLPLAIGVQRPASGGIAFTVCLPQADLPAGTPGRSPLGLKLVQLTLRLTGAFSVPTGTHVWHLKGTPYTPGSALANPAGAAEADAEHGAPPALTLSATAAGTSRSTVSGRLTLAGKGVAGRTVRILAGGKQVGTARTGASGAFEVTVAIGRPHELLTARAVVPARYVTPCPQPAFAPLPCTTSIVSGFAASARARVS